MVTPAYSFDIFDTVLTRIWAKPTDLFYQLGDRLRQMQLIQVKSDLWQRLRIEAEKAARQESATGEVTLVQIYEQLKQTCNWSEALTKAAMQVEIQLEQESLRVIPANQRKIQALHQQNRAIAFLSDMYLPSEVLRGFLKDHKLWAEGDVIRVSGESGVHKGNGALFSYHLAQSHLQAAQLCHTGDNLHSDIQMARKLGIAAEPFLDAHLNRYERAIAEQTQLPLRMRSLIAGASRLCRLQCPETDPHKQVIWNTAASVIAPIVFGFIHWVLLEAQRRGIRRLYFMARDGQILHKTAQLICRKWGYDIDCRYLYGSRQAFHFPSIQDIGAVEYSWLFDSPEFLSIRIICDRVNLTPEQIATSLIEHGFSSESWDQNLTKPELTKLKAVFQDPTVVGQVVELAKTYREAAITYLKQEGINDGVPFATVDTGWSGKSQRSLSKLLAIAKMRPQTGLHGFFFGLTGDAKFLDDSMHAYFIHPDNYLEKYFLCDTQILELFFAADHGSTLQYIQESDRAVPVLRSLKNEEGIRWGVLIQQQAVLDFTEQLVASLRPQDCAIADYQWITETLLDLFIHAPRKEEAIAFGTQSFSQHQSESRFYDLAPAYTLSDGFKILVNPKYIHSFAWLPASIQRSAFLTTLPLRYFKGLRRSYTYVWLSWRAFDANDHSYAWKMMRRAVQSFPLILGSRTFIRLTLSLAARSWLKPDHYSRLRQVFHRLPS
jgi:predicted HAD superfamily hydrolase